MAKRTMRRGFTLLEVLLVIVILAMLAGVVIVSVGGTQDKAKKDTTTVLVTSEIPGALDRYKFDVGHYPTEEEGGMAALVKKPANEEAAAKWGGPYLKQEPKDGWGHALRYEVVPAVSGSSESYKVSSDGPDGQPNTDDDIKYPPDETATP